MSKPAHKQDDPTYAPGQIVNRPEQTLGDYLARKNYHEAFDKVSEEVGLKRPPEKKLTFEEWFSQSGWAARNKPLMLDVESLNKIMSSVWKAAQDNV